jgi:hypothetical protein
MEYRKPKAIPKKLDPAKQAAFIMRRGIIRAPTPSKLSSGGARGGENILRSKLTSNDAKPTNQRFS